MVAVHDAVGILRTSVLKLRQHIYVAYCQWKISQSIPLKLIPMKSLHTIEDYQMNIGVMLDESPTSTHFGSNALSLACYPVHCDFCLDDNKIYHSAICFISDDMSHKLNSLRRGWLTFTEISLEWR